MFTYLLMLIRMGMTTPGEMQRILTCRGHSDVTPAAYMLFFTAIEDQTSLPPLG